MNTPLNAQHIIHRTDRYIHVAEGLCHFLRQSDDHDCVSYIERAIVTELSPNVHIFAAELSTIRYTHRPDWFAPSTPEQALRLYHWISAMSHQYPHQSAVARQTLTTWANHRQQPRDVILGIVGIAIIGPTLGLIKSKKRKKSQLRIVLPTAVYHATPKAELTALTHTISGRAVATELRRARGRVSALHPDTAEWLMSDHATTLYIADPDTFATIHHTLTSCTLPHISHQRSDSTIALGISPCLSDAFLADFAVTPVTESIPTETRH